MTGGVPRQCGTDSYHVYNATNLGDLLDGAGLSWAGFAESKAYPCDVTNPYPYLVKHNPFLYYRDIVGNASRCRAHELPLRAWNEDVANGTIPNFASIAPNMTDDGHNTNLTSGDSWLRGFLGPQLNASWMQSSAVFVTYDEGIGGHGIGPSGYNGTVGGHVNLAAAGPWVRANYTYPENASHYSLLSTFEWLLGLGTLGQHDRRSFPPLTSIFSFTPGSGSQGPPWPGGGLGLPGWWVRELALAGVRSEGA